MSQPSKYLLYVARATGLLSLGFLLFMIIGHLFGTQDNFNNGFTSTSEIMAFIFFPVGLIISLLTSCKNELKGGVLTLICLIGFHVAAREFTIIPFIDLLFLPGILFLIYGIMKNRK